MTNYLTIFLAAASWYPSHVSKVPTLGVDPPLPNRALAPPPRPIVSGPPAVLLSFLVGKQQYVTKLDVDTADGMRYTTGEIRIEAQEAAEACDVLLDQLGSSGFSVQKVGNYSVLLLGVKKEDGSVSSVTSVKLILREVKAGKPSATGLGSAKTELDD